jgi:hypothetical protein
MKMGTTVSPWRYDAAACRAIQSAMLRAPAILYYAPCAVPSWVSKSFTSGFLNDAEMHAKRRVQTERKGLDGLAAGPAVSTTSGA